MSNDQNLKRHDDVLLRAADVQTITPADISPLTDGDVAAQDKDAADRPGPNLYTGNIGYIKPSVNGSPDKAYVTVHTRFCNGHEQEEQVVQVYPSTKNGFKFEVGDLVAFEAKRIRKALDKDDKQMMMGEKPMFKAAGVAPDLELQLVRRAGSAVAAETKGEIKSEGLRAKLAALSPMVAKLLGIK